MAHKTPKDHNPHATTWQQASLAACTSIAGGSPALADIGQDLIAYGTTLYLLPLACRDACGFLRLHTTTPLPAPTEACPTPNPAAAILRQTVAAHATAASLGSALALPGFYEAFVSDKLPPGAWVDHWQVATPAGPLVFSLTLLQPTPPPVPSNPGHQAQNTAHIANAALWDVLLPSLANAQAVVSDPLRHDQQFYAIVGADGTIWHHNQKVAKICYPEPQQRPGDLPWQRSAAEVLGAPFWEHFQKASASRGNSPASQKFVAPLSWLKSQRMVSWTVAPLRTLSQRRGQLFQVVGQDITRLNHLFEVLKDKQDKLGHYMGDLESTLARLNQQRETIDASVHLAQIGEMAGGIAHEINNPLQVIQMAAELILEYLGRPEVDHKTVATKAQAIITTCNRISLIIKSMRNLAREGSDEPFTAQNLKVVIDTAVAFFREKFKKDGIQLDVQVEQDLALECRATQIGQVVINLVNNAAQAIAGSDHSWIKILAQQHESQAIIRVTDSGPGLSAEAKKRWSQPFFSTKKRGEGMGLGLTIVREILNQHGGTLTLDEAARNTCFEVRLPLRNPNV